jgi:DNA-binding beta-propeller fold protein YncE
VANGGTGYATGNTVSVINGRTCRAGDLAGCARRSPSVTVGRAPSALAVDPTTDTVYVTNGNHTVAVIDGAICNAEVGSGCRQRPPEVTVGPTPSSVAIDPANHTAYVTNAGGNDVSMISTLRCGAANLAGCGALRPPTVAVGVGPADVAVDELTHTVYVTNDDEMGPNDGTTMSVFDASTCNATTQRGCSHQGLVKVGTGPLAVAVDASTNTIYVANHTANLPGGAPSRTGTVSVINGRRCDAADLSGCRALTPGTVPVGWGPDFVALDGPGTRSTSRTCTVTRTSSAPTAGSSAVCR